MRNPVCTFERNSNYHIWVGIFILISLTASSCHFLMPPPCSPDYLIYKINSANATPSTLDAFDLSPGCVYSLDSINNHNNGQNGLPAVISPILINGMDATIQRNPDALEQFRLLYISGGGSLEINHLTLLGGYAYDSSHPDLPQTNSGGAIYNAGTLTVEKSIVKENRAYHGGGVFNTGTLNVADSIFSTNRSEQFGGALYNGASMVVQTSMLQENTGREGGGIFNAGTMDILDTTIDSNHDSFGLPWGAGLHNTGNGTIQRSTLSRNGVPEEADGMFNSNTGSLEISNSTISGNGGVGIDNEGTLDLNHVTFAGNGWGAFTAGSGNVTITNSLCAEDCCSEPAVHPTSPNIDTTGACGSFTVPPGALQLAPLGDYGGHTQTHALGTGSAAIDKADRQCLPTDQRGIQRPQGAKCDLGAFEYHSAQAPQVIETKTPTSTPTPQTCTFTARMNLFCRSGPGASAYPDVDSFTSGQSARVMAYSPDGIFAYVQAPNIDGICVVPSSQEFGTLEGDCTNLAIYTPPAPEPEPETSSEAQDSRPAKSGCTVRSLSGAITCQVPCPPGAVPGNPCTP